MTLMGEQQKILSSSAMDVRIIQCQLFFYNTLKLKKKESLNCRLMLSMHIDVNISKIINLEHYWY